MILSNYLVNKDKCIYNLIKNDSLVTTLSKIQKSILNDLLDILIIVIQTLQISKVLSSRILVKKVSTCRPLI